MSTRATSPAPRRRATNVTATPAVPVYETEARKFVAANATKNEAARLEKTAKLECHKAMLAANVGSFEIEVDGKTYDAVIAGGTTESINVEKLWAKIATKEITVEQFLKCVSASQAAVKKECGTNVMAGVIETAPKEADLSIKVRK